MEITTLAELARFLPAGFSEIGDNFPETIDLLAMGVEGAGVQTVEILSGIFLRPEGTVFALESNEDFPIIR